jgi:cytidylate kinase
MKGKTGSPGGAFAVDIVWGISYAIVGSHPVVISTSDFIASLFHVGLSALFTKAGAVPACPQPSRRTEMAVLSISRQFGAGGRTLAERLAHRLGYTYSDEELVSRLVARTGIEKEVVETAGHEATGKSKGFISGLLSTGFFLRVLGQASVESPEDKLASLLMEIIPEMAARGNIVFLGRGSQFILPTAPDIIKVFLTAEEEDRVRFMMERYDLNLEQAQKAVREFRKYRDDFLSRFTAYPNDVSIYSLCINTSLVSLETAENLICKLVELREKQEDPKEA